MVAKNKKMHTKYFMLNSINTTKLKIPSKVQQSKKVRQDQT